MNNFGSFESQYHCIDKTSNHCFSGAKKIRNVGGPSTPNKWQCSDIIKTFSSLATQDGNIRRLSTV